LSLDALGGLVGVSTPGPDRMVALAPPAFDQGDGEYQVVAWGEADGDRLASASIVVRMRE
jgi:hypothetical protein